MSRNIYITLLFVIFVLNNETARASTQTVSNIHFKSSKMNTSTKVQEIFKTIPNYPNYQVSNLGNLIVLPRYVKGRWGKVFKKGYNINGYITKKGYLRTTLGGKDGIRTHFFIHQLVAMAFLNHFRDNNKAQIDHIDNNRLNNNVNNLQILTALEHSHKTKKEIKSSSKYIGVSWFERDSLWRARFKTKHLGYFKTEIEASNAHKEAVKKYLYV